MKSSNTLLLAVFSPVLFAYGQVTTDEFTVSCAPLTLQRSDPVVFPGVASPHVHAVVGGTAFQRTMAEDTARNAKATTCSVDIDRSNYWIPQLYHLMPDGQFELIEFQGMSVYYMNRACNYTSGATACKKSEIPLAPPQGLRMVAGDPMRRMYNDSDFSNRATSHMCLKENTSTETKRLPQEPCLRLRSQVFFPSCWDGENLDSESHSGHMAYPAVGDYNGGVCPQSHPVAIFSVFYEFFFDTSKFLDDQNWVYATGDKDVGYALHGDYIQGWTDQDALQQALETCTGPQGESAPTCSVTKGQVKGGSTQPLEVPAPDEELGQNGPLPKLPGNNHIIDFGGNGTSAAFGSDGE